MNPIKDKLLDELCRAAKGWGIELCQTQSEQVRRYVEDLLSYNAKTNLTAETDPRLIILRHVADGMAAVPALKRVLGALAAPRILDLGSGGGFIGMGLKIAWPQADVTLMESVERKYRFLSGTAMRSGLKNLHVTLSRAGAGAASGKTYDAVTARAVAEMPQVVRLAAPLLNPRGFLLVYQSAPPPEDDADLKKSLAGTGGRLVECLPYRLPAEIKERYLALFDFAGGG